MIKVSNLVKNFGARAAVRGVSFEVKPGEVLGFLGPNGAGKTTTMRMITGFLSPTSGSARINNYDVSEKPVEARTLLGYLPENAPSYGDMTVEEFLSFAAAMRGFRGKTARHRISETLDKCFLTSVRNQPIETLSKGYRQRTCFAQAILHDPPALILDEPTEGLDPNQKFVVRNMIRDMAKQKAVIFSTHILEEVEAICTRAIIISKGSIVADSAPAELKQQGSLDEVFRRLTTTADVGGVAQWGPVCTILKREWRAYFNSPVAYVFIVIFLALAGFFTFNVGRFYEAGQASLDRSFFWHPWIYLILIPAVSMRLWAEERRTGTLELLLTFPVTTAQAIAGKFIAAWLFILLALVLTFPVVLTAFYLGSPDPGPIIAGYIGSALLAGAYLAVGMFTSAITRNQVISFILSAVIGLFLLLAGYPPVTDFLYGVAPSWVVETVAGFSFSTHFEQMQRGIIDLRDIVYFASVMGFMLLATHVTLNNRRTK